MAALGTGVTIGSRTIRVLEVKKLKSGSWQVTKALIAPMDDPGANDARRVSEAKAALKTSGAKGRALVGLSGKDLIIRYTQVPPVPDWRLEMLMNFEIQEVSEQSGGDVSAAYAPLAIDDATSGDNVVLVALAKNGHLKPRLDALREAGLDVLGGCPRAVAGSRRRFCTIASVNRRLPPVTLRAKRSVPLRAIATSVFSWPMCMRKTVSSAASLAFSR